MGSKVITFIKKHMEKRTHSDGNFDVHGYISTYYPVQIDIEKSYAAYERFNEEFKNPDQVLDITKIAEDLELDHELVENACIFHFQKEVVKSLLDANLTGTSLSLIDIGSGPTMYQHIMLSLFVDSIIHAEYLQTNIDEARRWQQSHKSSYDWDEYFALIKKILSTEESIKKSLQDRVGASDGQISKNAQKILATLDDLTLQSFKADLQNKLGDDIILCDAFKEDLAHEDEREAVKNSIAKIDDESIRIASSYFVLECISTSKEEWQNGFTNLCSPLKSGDYLISTSVRNATWYKDGTRKIPIAPVNEDDYEKAFEREGLEMIHRRVITGSNVEEDGYEGMVMVFARKK